MSLIPALVFATAAAWAQTGALQLSSPQPTGVTDSSAANVGIAQGGGTDIYYWVFARMPGGYVAPRTPAIARRTFGPTLLSVSNYIRVSWSSVAGATGYDVLRSTSPLPPFLPCTCAIALNVAGGPVLDTGAGLSAYPPIASHGQASGTIIINNRDEAQPFLNLRMVRNGIESLTRLLELSGTPAEDDCLKFSNGRAASAGGPCGSGGGALPAGSGFVVHLGGGVVAARSIVASDGISCFDGNGVAGNTTCIADQSVLLSKREGQRGNIYTGTTTGTSTAYALILAPCPDAYYEGMEIRPHLHVASGANPTMNVCTLGARKIYRRVLGSTPVQVAANDASANLHLLTYDATLDGAVGGWLMNLPGAGGSAPAPLFGAFAGRPPCNSSNTGQDFYPSELQSMYYRCDGSSWRAVAFGHEMTLPPAAGSFTAVGASTVSVSTIAGVLKVFANAAGTALGSQMIAIPAAGSPPFSLETEFSLHLANTGATDFPNCGIIVANGGTSAASAFAIDTGVLTGSMVHQWHLFTNYSAYNGPIYSLQYQGWQTPSVRMKYRYAGANAHELYRYVGADWELVATSNNSLVPTHWGVSCSFGNSGGVAQMVIYNWVNGN